MPLQFTKLTSGFYQNQTCRELAKNLLGKILVKKTRKLILKGIINEVEVYEQNDPASHSFQGMTKRNKMMFEKAGTLYIYFIYGNYYCLNVVSGDLGNGEAVLIRSLIPTFPSKTKKDFPLNSLNSLVFFQQKRNYHKPHLKHLLNGPGKICQAFDIDLKENGLDLITSENIFLLDFAFLPQKITSSPRIGISKGKKKLLNFSINEV